MHAAELCLFARRDRGVGVARGVPRERQADHDFLEETWFGGARVDAERVRGEVDGALVVAELQGALSRVGEEREERALRGGHRRRLVRGVAAQHDHALRVSLDGHGEVAGAERCVARGSRAVGGAEGRARWSQIERAGDHALDVGVDVPLEGLAIHRESSRGTVGGEECAPSRTSRHKN